MDEIEKPEIDWQPDETEETNEPAAAGRGDVEPAAAAAARATEAAPASRAEPHPEPQPAAQPPPAPFIDGQEHAVDPRSVTATRIVTILPIIATAFLPFLGVTLGWALDGIPDRVYLALVAGWIVLLSGALIFAYKLPELHHKHLRYRVDETGVRIRRGIWWRKVISIPTSRVQHTDVSQGPLQRNFELATLTVFTAGTEGASISLEGLEHGVAKRLRDHLLPDHHADAI